MARPKTSKTGEIIPETKAIVPSGQPTLAQLLLGKAMQAEMAAAVPEHIRSERMVRLALTALRRDAKLQACDQLSFMGCLFQAAQLGLEFNTPLQHCYLIPRKRKEKDGGGYECTFLLGYQGMIDLALRSGKVTSVVARAVYKGDEFDHDYGLDQHLLHKSGEGEPTFENLTHVYAVARIRDADPAFEVLTRAQILARRARSDAYRYGKGPWVTDPVPMARKSGVRALWAWMPKSVEMATALSVEQAHERGSSRVLDSYGDQVATMLEEQGLRGLEDADDGVIDAEASDDELTDSERLSREETREYGRLVDLLSAKGGEFAGKVDRITAGAPDLPSALVELRKMAGPEELDPELVAFVRGHDTEGLGNVLDRSIPVEDKLAILQSMREKIEGRP